VEVLSTFILEGGSTFWTFLAIAVFGFVFLTASAVFGDIFDHGDIGHDSDGHGGGPSILSSRVLSVFVTAFGSFGAIGTHLGYGLGLSLVMGFGGGVAFAAVIYFFAWFLFSQQATSTIRTGELKGRTGNVSVAIPKGGVGQVRCTVGDTAIEKIARSVDGGDIAENTLVKVEDIVGETVLVRRAE
jgi:membrane protein implicated in regulation of membrane protease activity